MRARLQTIAQLLAPPQLDPQLLAGYRRWYSRGAVMARAKAKDVARAMNDLEVKKTMKAA